jgi:Secretion system C-terminal sorting domain
MPLRVELSGSYDGNDFAKKMTISEADMGLSDNTLTSYWAGQNILKLENSNQYDNNTIQQIIENSMNNRILSRYTAFLALEPSQGGDTCRTCDKNNTATTPTKDLTDSKFKLTASPNPFKSETVINITFETWKNNSKAKLVIYDLTGKIVKTFDLDIKQGDTELSFRWEAYDLPAGIYMVKFTSGAIQKTIKLVKME